MSDSDTLENSCSRSGKPSAIPPPELTMRSAVFDHARRRQFSTTILVAARLSLLCFLFFPFVAFGQWTSLGPVRSARQDDPFSAEVATRSGRVILVTYLTPDLVRITIGPNAELPEPTPAVLRRTWDGDKVRFSQTKSEVDISGSMLHVRIDKKNSSIRRHSDRDSSLRR